MARFSLAVKHGPRATGDRRAGRRPSECSPVIRRPRMSRSDVADLTKRYGSLEAVRGISFAIPRGEIFGLIGPDGAGKTTTFQILAGVMEATSGVAEIFGRHAREARAQTGYLTQTFSLYPDLTVSENIQYIGDLRRVPRAELDRRGHRYLQMFDMDRFTDRLAGRLKRRHETKARARLRAGSGTAGAAAR